jgi:hypothetical protein
VEADRLEVQHQVFNIVFDDRLVFPPLSDLQAVLDLGYGAASWAIAVADTYPDCEVSTQPTFSGQANLGGLGDWSGYITSHEA